jgi:hypothetical protein
MAFTMFRTTIKKFLILFLSAVVLAAGCVETEIREKPETVLPEAKMIEVLTAIQLIEGAISKKILDKNVTKKESPLYYQQAFDKYKITRQQFEESIAYYTENPEEMKAIYEKVLVELSKIKAELQNSTPQDLKEPV